MDEVSRGTMGWLKKCLPEEDLFLTPKKEALGPQNSLKISITMLNDCMFKGMSKWHVSYSCQKIAKNTLTQMRLTEIKGSIILRYYSFRKV